MKTNQFWFITTIHVFVFWFLLEKKHEDSRPKQLMKPSKKFNMKIETLQKANYNRREYQHWKSRLKLLKEKMNEENEFHLIFGDKFNNGIHDAPLEIKREQVQPIVDEHINECKKEIERLNKEFDEL